MNPYRVGMALHPQNAVSASLEALTAWCQVQGR